MTTIRRINFQFFIYLIIVFLCSAAWVKDVSALIGTNQPFRHPILEKWGEDFNFRDQKVEIIGFGMPQLHQGIPISIAHPDTVEKIVVQVVFKGSDPLSPGIHAPYPPGNVTVDYVSHKKLEDTGNHIVISKTLTPADRINPVQSPKLDHYQYLYTHTLRRNEVLYDIEAIGVIVENRYISPRGHYTPRAVFVYIFRQTPGSHSTEIGTINRGYAWHVPWHPNRYRPEDFLYIQDMDIPRGESNRDIAITFAISELEQTPPGGDPRGVILAAEYAGIVRKRAVYIHSNLGEQALVDTLVLKDVPGQVTKIKAMVIGDVNTIDPVTGKIIGSDSVYVNGINIRIEGDKGQPGISIKKEVSLDGGDNWHDADAAPGPEADYCNCGDAMFRISVENTGEAPLEDINLTDDTYPDAVYDACRWKIPDIMQPGDKFTCEFTVPVEQGQHTNIATVTAKTDAATSDFTVIKSYHNSYKTDTWVTNDKFEYYEKEYGVTSVFIGQYVKKQYIGNYPNQYYAPRYFQEGMHPIYSCMVDYGNSVVNHYLSTEPCDNGIFPKPPLVAAWGHYAWDVNNGVPVFWLFDDDNSTGDRRMLYSCWDGVNGDTLLSDVPCSNNSMWPAPPHEGLGYALINSDIAMNPAQVQASNPANYIADTPQLGLDVEKYISADGETWEDADTPDSALELSYGEDVYFKFVVTNNSASTLTDVVLNDTHFNTDGCIPETLEPNESFNCILGPFEAHGEQHTNTASVVGYCCNLKVDDQDDANYKTPIPAHFGGYLFWKDAMRPKCQKEIQFTILLDDYTSDDFDDKTLIGRFCEVDEKTPCASQVEFKIIGKWKDDGISVEFGKSSDKCIEDIGQYRLWVTGRLNDGNRFEGLSEDIVTFY